MRSTAAAANGSEGVAGSGLSTVDQYEALPALDGRGRAPAAAVGGARRGRGSARGD